MKINPQTSDKRTHTTLNLSDHLINEALKVFKGLTKTEVIHEALKRVVQMEKMDRHLKHWKGKGRFKSHG
ncbi:MAG TPA: hypothetical protein DDW49_10005 [Deltaproteobacteria bacterium]|nr:MAG: hypothetical protein A2048_02695 [Deltaproteobacteria bacterium GWA2_45_12]HBF13697.1 hypothetical protein [Deltaproteobacteria bacterium]